MRPGTTMLRVLLLLGFGIGCVWDATASNWPRFRGPNGTGVSQDKDVPVAWTDKSGLVWKTPIPGVGNSSPVVWGNQLFMQSADNKGKERLLLCLNTTNGKVQWSKSLPAAFSKTHARNSLASSTPATDGERVYAMIWDGKDVFLYAFDMKGKQLWKYGMGSFKSQHGAGASPIVCQDKVILNNDQDGKAEVIAVDAKTGKFAWKVTREAYRTCYSTPFLLETKDKSTQLIVLSTAGITSYDPQNGKQNWHWSFTFDGMALRTVGSPIYSDGMIFATGGDGSGLRHASAIKVGDKGDVTSTNLLWENKKTLPYVPTLLAQGEHIYFVNDLGVAGCCEAKTGKIVWTERIGAMNASPVLINGNIYAASEDGYVYVFPAAPEFKLLAKNSVGEPVVATPAVADNRLYIRGKTHLYCIGKPANQ